VALARPVKEAGRRVEDVERRERECRFQRLYESHYGAVLAYAQRRTSGAPDAHDIVAETFTVAWRRIDDVPDTDAALPWLYGVARRVLANQRRGGRRRADLSARLRTTSAAPVEIDAEVLAADDRRIVLAALARLKEADREILRLATWEELSHREIASIVECSEASVAVRLHRARNRLGKEITKEAGRAGHEGSASSRRRAEGQHP
jgi:RNA polymerase sigma-70 factor (ECF subfamily)